MRSWGFPIIRCLERVKQKLITFIFQFNENSSIIRYA